MTGVSFIIHEKLTVCLSGYIHDCSKNGYDGYKTLGNKTYYCEAKTSNMNTEKTQMYLATRRGV